MRCLRTELRLRTSRNMWVTTSLIEASYIIQLLNSCESSYAIF
jgi:hypothetical protein